MNINIQYLNAEPDWETKDFISEKIGKLQSRYNSIMGLRVYLKDENHNRKTGKVVEMKLEIPDKTLFAESRAENFHVAAKEAMAGIVSQLRKIRIKRTVPAA